VTRSLPLLFEIGCEEIPARFLAEAEKNYGQHLQTALAEACLLPVEAVREPPLQNPLRTYSTPRRLVAYVSEVLEKQPDKVEELLGPPVKVAFDAQGKPTRAAESFAQKNAASLKELLRVTTAKGEYLALKKTTAGRPAKQLLPEILPAVLSSLTFPKSMYWVAKAGPRFVRPVRWLLALLGEGKQAHTIRFEYAGVRSGDFTFGHRALGKGSIRVSSFKDYAKRLRQAGVEFEREKRREITQNQCKVILENTKLNCLQDKELEEWIVNSTECPRALLGNFDGRFLHLPREILVTVMRDHQKYFAVQDRKGNLQPQFVAVLNLAGDRKGLIRQGHEKVLAARFSDAEFFWQTDQKVPLRDRPERLARVTYEAELGSYAEKVRRMKALASEVLAKLQAQGKLTPGEVQHTLRAVELAKCDLTTQMVQEFPELQGVVGGLYARAQGEPAEVAEAIYDHYLPQSMEDRCPRTVMGAVVSLADKLDSVVGGFATGREPTGSSDPFALRRQGNGIIKVLLEVSLSLSLPQMVEQALNLLDIPWRKPRFEVWGAVMEFFGERLRYYMETAGKLRYDTARAVLAAGYDLPLEALGRAAALERIRGSEDFEALCVAAKRIKNILAKSATASDWQAGEVEAGMLKDPVEAQLYRTYISVAARASEHQTAGEYPQALEAIAGLRPAVDRFFDKVLVMAEDPALRQNRLRLLGKLDELFSGIAQFAGIAEARANVDASTSGNSKPARASAEGGGT